MTVKIISGWYWLKLAELGQMLKLSNKCSWFLDIKSNYSTSSKAYKIILCLLCVLWVNLESVKWKLKMLTMVQCECMHMHHRYAIKVVQ